MEQVIKILWGSPAAANLWGLRLGVLHSWALPLPGGCQCLWWSDHIRRLGHLRLGEWKLPGVPDNQGMQCNKHELASQPQQILDKFGFFFNCLNSAPFYIFRTIHLFTLRAYKFLPISSVSVWWARRTLMSVHTGGGEYTGRDKRAKRKRDSKPEMHTTSGWS